MDRPRQDIRFSLPSKGRLAGETMQFLEAAGLKVVKPNPRQLTAHIPALPELTVLFQRTGDIVHSVRNGSADFGITGWDVLQERGGNGAVLPLLKELGYGHCSLNVIVPEGASGVQRVTDLPAWQASLDRPLRAATKFPHLAGAFFRRAGMEEVTLIEAEGALEAAPAIGYADLIVDLISTGTTLRDNRLRALDDGSVLESQTCLIGNRAALRRRPEVLEAGRLLLEFIEAHLRAKGNVSVFANMCGESPEAIAERMYSQEVIGGLEGPTISPVVSRMNGNWYAVHIIVRRDQLTRAISELRSIGGSGVVVTRVAYIFEDQTEAVQAMLAAIGEGGASC